MRPINVASPNFGPRRDGLRPELVVLHYTAMASAEAALERLCDPAFEVSAHYLISRRGRVYQLVEEQMRAWHAGAGSWGGRGDVNSRSIGIELDNDGESPFAAPLMAALEQLLAGVMARWAIVPQGVIAHSDMAPGRKSDPGARFDWQRLARQGLSVWPALSSLPVGRSSSEEGPQGTEERAFDAAARAFGYDSGAQAAFRLRFRPWAQGPICGVDLAMMRDLARRFPVDRAVHSA